jgi:hypothetical protein
MEKFTIGKDDVKSFLEGITDEDYNGHNGPDYFTKLHTEFGDMLISRLEKAFFKCKVEGASEEQTIRDILEDNYSDPYYRDSSVKVEKYQDCIFVSIAYTE